MKPIYVPNGKAKEYGDFALNIYTGCPHACYYCYAAGMAKRFGNDFAKVEPRKGIVEATKRQLEREGIKGKLIHLCFTCDPYPTGHDTTTTREIIKAIKESGNHVQILTKGDGSRDFDLLDKNDWYGITLSGATHEQESGALDETDRINILLYLSPCNRWISFEPVVQERYVLALLRFLPVNVRVKIGKLNYHPSDINWAEFGYEAEKICKARGLDYYIKDALRLCMEDKS